MPCFEVPAGPGRPERRERPARVCQTPTTSSVGVSTHIVSFTRNGVREKGASAKGISDEGLSASVQGRKRELACPLPRGRCLCRRNWKEERDKAPATQQAGRKVQGSGRYLRLHGADCACLQAFSLAGSCPLARQAWDHLAARAVSIAQEGRPDHDSPAQVNKP